MPLYGSRATGRTVSLEYYGDISVARYLKVECIDGEPVDTATARGAVEGGALGCQVGCATGAGGSIPISCTPSNRNMSTKVYAEIPGIFGAPGRVEANDPNPQVFPGTYDNDATGSYSITGTFDEWEGWSLLESDRTMIRVDAYGWPLEPVLNGSGNEISSYGSSQGDGLVAYHYNRYLVSQIGSAVACTITLGASTAANSVTISALNQFVLVHSFGGGVDYGSRWVSDVYWSNLGRNTHVTTKVKVNGGAEIDLGCPLSAASSDGWFSVNGSVGASATAISHFGEGQCAVALFPALAWSIDARARCFNNSYPDPGLKLNYVSGSHVDGSGNQCATISQGVLGPDLSVSVSMPRYAGVGYRGGSTDTSHAPPWISTGGSFATVYTDQWWPQRLWLNTGSLALTSDDTRDFDVRIGGFAWSPFNLKRSGEVTVDACTATTNWAAGANTTISISGGRLKADAAGGTGSLTLTVPAGLTAWEYFRYLRLNLEGTASMSLTIGIAGQTWDTSATTTRSNKDLDLTLASSDAATSGSRESRWPTTAYDTGWGVDQATTVVISGITNGQSLYIGGVTLHLSSLYQSFTFLEPFRQRFSVSGPTTAEPIGFIETEGRYSDTGVSMTLAGGVPSWTTIAALETAIAVPPGLTVTVAADPADGFHNAASVEAGRIGDSTYDNGAWHDWIERNLSATRAGVAVYAQDRLTELDIWPWAGDFWETGTYEVPLKARATKRLRADAWGLVYKSTKEPSVGTVVELAQDLGAGMFTNRGSGTSTAIGSYETALPYGYGNVNHRIRRQGTTTPFVDKDPVANRFRHRGCLLVSSGQPAGPSIFETLDGQVWLAYINPDGDVVVLWTLTDAPYSGWQHTAVVTSTGDCGSAEVYVDMTTITRSWVIFDREVSPGNWSVYESYSDDYDLTWSTPDLVVAGAQRPGHRVHPNGERLQFWFVYDSGTSGPGKVHGQTWGTGDTGWSASFTFKDGLGADLSFADGGFSGGMVDGGRASIDPWEMSGIIDGESDPAFFQSFDSARTWNRII